MHEPSGTNDGRIRHATRDDIAPIRRLMLRAQADDGVPRISEPEIAELMNRGEIIVLDSGDNEVLAAACLTTHAGRGHLAFLVVDPRIPDLETRIRSVAGALSESERCEPSFAPAFRHAS
jgi:N-acetylglutamate synthase-like GNAT family acetyltransferase